MNKEKIDDLANYIWEGGLHLADIKGSIEEWFEQNPQEPVVGLTDEQCDIFGGIIDDEEGTNYVGKYLKEWLKTQDFAEPCTCGINLGEVRDNLHKDFLSVCRERNNLQDELEQLKAQQFQPNWDDAPDRAVNRQITHCWYDALGIPLEYKILLDEQRPKPPAPKVEVGQTWKYTKSGKLYIILALGDMKSEDDEAVCFPDWVDSVTYRCNESNRVFTRTLDDFLDKFEQVG